MQAELLFVGFTAAVEAPVGSQCCGTPPQRPRRTAEACAGELDTRFTYAA
jgi:hypothetical protein